MRWNGARRGRNGEETRRSRIRIRREVESVVVAHANILTPVLVSVPQPGSMLWLQGRREGRWEGSSEQEVGGLVGVPEQGGAGPGYSL